MSAPSRALRASLSTIAPTASISSHIGVERFFTSLSHGSLYVRVLGVQIHLKRFVGDRRRRESLGVSAHMLEHARSEHMIVQVVESSDVWATVIVATAK